MHTPLLAEENVTGLPEPPPVAATVYGSATDQRVGRRARGERDDLLPLAHRVGDARAADLPVGADRRHRVRVCPGGRGSKRAAASDAPLESLHDLIPGPPEASDASEARRDRLTQVEL